MGAWRDDPPPASAFASEQAFLADTMTFFQWIQWVLLVRIRDIVEEKSEFPGRSQVGTYGVREFDGYDEASGLVELLCAFDSYIETGGPPPPVAMRTAAPQSVPEAPAEPVETLTPAEVVEAYWRTRDSRWLVSRPSSRPTMDVQLVEGVFDTVEGFDEFAGEPREMADGIAVDAVVRASRGPWVVRTVLRRDPQAWRIDLPLSLRYTALMFLYQHGVNAPYTEVDDARGRAMRFWHAAANRDERRARELALDPAAEIPRPGDGAMDEFCWYISHTEEGATATVRVLMNTHQEQRVWPTRMVKRQGAWYVDVAATLRASCTTA